MVDDRKRLSQFVDKKRIYEEEQQLRKETRRNKKNRQSRTCGLKKIEPVGGQKEDIRRRAVRRIKKIR